MPLCDVPNCTRCGGGAHGTPTFCLECCPGCTPVAQPPYTYCTNCSVPSSEAATGGALFDEFVPQLYRAKHADFAPLLRQTAAALAPALASPAVDAGVGIRIDGSGAPTTWPELRLMIEDTMAARPGLGVGLWYSHGVLELYREQLTALFDAGPTPTPPTPTPAPPAPGPAPGPCCVCVSGGGGAGCESACVAQGAQCRSCLAGGGGRACGPKDCGC
jgi:hypothetical protein